MKNLTELTENELLNIEGGGFWGDLAYAVAYTIHAASEISNSLSSNPSYGNANVYK